MVDEGNEKRRSWVAPGGDGGIENQVDLPADLFILITFNNNPTNVRVSADKAMFITIFRLLFKTL